MKNSTQVVAIDGPAGSGKSTVATAVAEKLGWDYIDTGAMYRAVCLKALQDDIRPDDESSIVSIMDDIDFEMTYSDGELTIIMNGSDVSDTIRSNRVDKNVSEVAALSEVREKLVELQRRMGNEGEVVMDGRDIGSVVFPHAQFKFYLDASLEERARRRYNQIKSTDEGDDVPQFESVLKELKSRDETDRKRDKSPLKVPENALYIDTTDMSVKEVVEKLLQSIE